MSNTEQPKNTNGLGTNFYYGSDRVFPLKTCRRTNNDNTIDMWGYNSGCAVRRPTNNKWLYGNGIYIIADKILKKCYYITF